MGREYPRQQCKMLLGRPAQSNTPAKPCTSYGIRINYAKMSTRQTKIIAWIVLKTIDFYCVFACLLWSLTFAVSGHQITCKVAYVEARAMLRYVGRFLATCWALIGPMSGHLRPMLGLCCDYVGPFSVHIGPVMKFWPLLTNVEKHSILEQNRDPPQAKAYISSCDCLDSPMPT